ncbi:MAG: hypothetical protein GWP09_01720 [Nitrospiraceae bacterium]|nr:hypothetical protein [Nitrospiraceae bacterium]
MGVKKIEKENFVTVEDSKGNKYFVHGSINGVAVKVAGKGVRKTHSIIVGLDNSWIGKKVLCVLLEG